MKEKDVGFQLKVSHPDFRNLVDPVLDRTGLQDHDEAKPGVAEIILDYPLTWAFDQLEEMDSIQRARTLVVTQAVHPAYLDSLASYHVSSVVISTDRNGLLSGIYAAASSQRSYHWRSELTYMELRVTRLLIRGKETKEIAEELQVSYKTINAHVSNILCKLGLTSRAQFLATLIRARVDT